MLCKRTSWTATALSSGLKKKKKINDLFVFKSVKSYGDFFLSANLVGKVNWKKFPASVTSVGRPSTGCENPSPDVVVKALTEPQKSLPSLLYFYWVNKGNSHHCDWLILWQSSKDAGGIISAAAQTSQTLAASTFSPELQLPCYFSIRVTL